MSQVSIKQKAYSAIEAKYRCAHEVRELRLRKIKDGRLAYYRQCTLCGNAGAAISAKVAVSEHGSHALPVFDDDLEHQWYSRKSVEYLEAYQKIKPSLCAEYDAYLASAAWAERRAVILKRANGVCECCEYYPATQVHHKTYERIGQEHESDLMAVCSFCHGLLHGRAAL